MKRGVSDVVATVLVVLITIAAAAVLFSAVIPFVKKSLSTSTECISYRDYFEFEQSLGYTCFDANNLTAFSIRAKSAGDAEDLDRFDVALTREGSSKKVSIVAGSSTNAGAGGVRLLDKSITILSVPKSGEVQTYVYNGAGERYSKIEIYPVLKSGKICDKSAEISLSVCKGVVLT